MSQYRFYGIVNFKRIALGFEHRRRFSFEFYFLFFTFGIGLTSGAYGSNFCRNK